MTSQDAQAAASVAWSVDGRRFGVRSAVDHPAVPGDHVRLVLPDGRRVLGRLLSKDVAESAGSAGDGPMPMFGMRTAHGEGDVLGVLDGDDITVGPAFPFDGAAMHSADDHEVASYLDTVDAGRTTTVVGAVKVSGEQLPARVRLEGFNRHTFVCGQSGSGKTFSLGTLVERVLVGTSLRIVVLDPNGDFVRIDELRDQSQVATTIATDEAAREVEVLRRRHAGLVDQLRIHTHDGPYAPTARLLDMEPGSQAALLRLDPIADRAEYSDAVDLMSGLRRFRSGGGTMPSAAAMTDAHDGLELLVAEAGRVTPELALRLKNLGLVHWEVWARERASVVDSIAAGARATVADLGALPDDSQRNVLSLSVLEYLWERRSDRVPTLIVIDEAHTLVPRRTDDPVLARCRDLVVRIAGEGRKYGLILMLASQRPDKVDANAISQCDNLVLMRMNARSDVEALEALFSFVPPALVRQSTAFGQGEAVLAGPIVHGPSRIRFGGRCTAEGGSDLPTDWAEGLVG